MQTKTLPNTNTFSSHFDSPLKQPQLSLIKRPATRKMLKQNEISLNTSTFFTVNVNSLAINFTFKHNNARLQRAGLVIRFALANYCK